ncbi:MAG: 30S ribosomal protein S5 [Elusimicrobiota bacterium]
MITKNSKSLKNEKEFKKSKPEEGYVEIEEEQEKENIITVAINRVSKVVKGGKRMSFNALVVVGNGNGTVGASLGKANEVQDAISKATSAARKSQITFPLLNGTIPHEIVGKFGSGHVWMKPAVEGTGLISGGGMRAVLEAAGIRNILTKNLGSRNPFNSVYATIEALKKLKVKEDVMDMRK